MTRSRRVQAECAHGLRHPPRFRGPGPRHHRHRHRFRAALLRREPPPRRERPRGLRGRRHHLVGARPRRRARGEGPAPRGGRLRDRHPRPPRPRGRGGGDDAAAAGGAPRRPPPGGPAHDRPVEAPGRGRRGVRRGGGRPRLRDARPGRPVAGDRGSRGPPPRARRTAPPLPGHARARAPPLLRLGRGLPLHVHRGHLRPRVPRAREPARRVRPAHHDTGAVRAGGAPRVDRPAARVPAGGDDPHPLLARDRDRAAGRRPAAGDRRARGARPPGGRQARPGRAPAGGGGGARSSAGPATTAPPCPPSASASCWPWTSSSTPRASRPGSTGTGDNGGHPVLREGGA